MEAEKIALIFNRICGYSGRFFYVEGDRIVERGDWVKGGEREYTLVEAERWLAVELYSKKVITLMELQPLEDRMKRLKSYIEELGPEGRRLLMAREERAKKDQDQCSEPVDAVVTPPIEGKQPVFNDARIADDAKEAKAVLAMVDAVGDYGPVMDACLEEAGKLIPKIVKDDQPVQQSRFEARIKIALALYNRATQADPQANLDKYLNRLIDWYTAKDSPPGQSGASPITNYPGPPPAIPFPFYPARPSPTERLATLFLDFLESRVGVIFGEVKEGRDGKADEGRSDAPGA